VSRWLNGREDLLDEITCLLFAFLNMDPRRSAMLGTILLVILILMLVGALPTWGHSRTWGYGPSGGLGLVALVVIVLLLLGRI